METMLPGVPNVGSHIELGVTYALIRMLIPASSRTAATMSAMTPSRYRTSPEYDFTDIYGWLSHQYVCSVVCGSLGGVGLDGGDAEVVPLALVVDVLNSVFVVEREDVLVDVTVTLVGFQEDVLLGFVEFREVRFLACVD